MNYLRVLLILLTITFTSCGFEDNLPCKASECENVPEPLPILRMKDKKNPHVWGLILVNQTIKIFT